MKRYSASEPCPMCGGRRHCLRACFGNNGTFACCASEANEKDGHVHRECLRCGASYARAALRPEALAQIVVFDERDIVPGRRER